MQATDRSARDFLDRSREFRRLAGETWATFMLVFVACSGEMAGRTGLIPPVIGAIAPGAMVICAIYSLGAVSGAHLNPAVTFAFALRGNFPWGRAPGYVAAQCAGGVAAVALLRLLLGDVGDLGATYPKGGLAPFAALAFETVLTAGLVHTILGTASGARNVGTNAGIAVGAYIALAGIVGHGFTGPSMNPARSLAPDLLRRDFATTWIYIAGPLLGAMLGVALEFALKGPPTRSGDKAAQGEGR